MFSKKETALIRRLIAMDSCEQDSCVEDGGEGSGNWGHKGRPGKKGGSGKGGGKKYRSEKAGGGYEQKKLDPKEAVAKVGNTGRAAFNRGSGQKFTPKGKPAFTPKNDPKSPISLKNQPCKLNKQSAPAEAIRNTLMKNLDRVAGNFNKIANGETPYGPNQSMDYAINDLHFDASKIMKQIASGLSPQEKKQIDQEFCDEYADLGGKDYLVALRNNPNTYGRFSMAYSRFALKKASEILNNNPSASMYEKIGKANSTEFYDELRAKGNNEETPSTPAPAQKTESKAVAGLRESIANGNNNAAAARLDKFPAGTEITYNDGKNEYKLTKQPDQYGVPGNWVGTRNGKYDISDSFGLAYSLKQNGGKFDVKEKEQGSQQSEPKEEPEKKASNQKENENPALALGNKQYHENVLNGMAEGTYKGKQLNRTLRYGDTDKIQSALKNFGKEDAGSIIVTPRGSYYFDGKNWLGDGYDRDPSDQDDLDSLTYELAEKNGHVGKIDEDLTKKIARNANLNGYLGAESIPIGTAMLCNGWPLIKVDENRYEEIGRPDRYCSNETIASMLEALPNPDSEGWNIGDRGAFAIIRDRSADGDADNLWMISEEQPLSAMPTQSSASQTSDPFARSLARTKTAEGVRKAVNGLLSTKQGSFFVDGNGKGYFVGFDGKLHSSDGIVVQPNNKKDLELVAQKGIFRGNGALVSESKMDRNATRNLLNSNTASKAIASMPNESRIMIPPTSTFVKTDKGWVDTTSWGSKNPASDEEMIQKISELEGFGNPDAVEKKGFITKSKQYEHPHPFAAFVPDNFTKNSDERGMTELERW